MMLTANRDTASDHGTHRVRWGVVRLEPLAEESPADVIRPEYELGWIWAALNQDSLELLRPAELGEGIIFVGAWWEDTLHARVNTFGDGGVFPQARGNAFAVRYDCSSVSGATAASDAVEAMRKADIPNKRLSQQADRNVQAVIEGRQH